MCHLNIKISLFGHSRLAKKYNVNDATQLMTALYNDVFGYRRALLMTYFVNYVLDGVAVHSSRTSYYPNSLTKGEMAHTKENLIIVYAHFDLF